MFATELNNRDIDQQSYSRTWDKSCFCSEEHIFYFQFKMKIFQTVQKQYAIVGIESSSPSNQWIQKCPFNERILFGFLLFGCLILLQFVYLLHVASSFMEFMVAACSTSASITMFTCFAAIVYRKSTLFDCIVNGEKLQDTSASHTFIQIS